MEWQELILDGYGRILEVLEKALEDLTPDDLNEQPHPDCNSIGWLTWHLTRGQDAQISRLMGEPQLWISEGWHAKFNRPDDKKDTGFGASPEDVAAFKSPDAETLLAYHRAVLERSKRYLTSLPASELGRELNEPWFQPPPTVGVRLVSIVIEDAQHAGQISYIRGLLKGKGWSKI